MSDTNELYIDAFQEEVGLEISKLFSAAVARHRSTGAALDGPTLVRLRAAVREHVQALPEILDQVLPNKLAASSGTDGELRKRFPAAFNRRIR